VAGSLSNESGFFAVDASTGRWVRLSEGVQRAASDPQPLPALRYAVAHDLARVIGEHTVAGHTCTLVRTGAPFGEPLAAPTDADHVDICVAASGVMLEYEWTTGGNIVQTSVATAFDADPSIAATAFTLEPPPAPNDAAVNVTPLAPDQFRPFPAFVPPTEFVLRNAYLSVDPSHQRDTRTVAILVRGTDAFSLTFGEPVARHDGTETVDLGNGYAGELEVRLDSVTLTVAVPPSVTVTFLGAAPDDVISLARRLQRS
jgi:hypothetical protein